MMHSALEPYYGGDHRAHAKRIVETAANGTEDNNGHFSAAQHMYVSEQDGNIIGILNFVVKYQSTIKISPLIVRKEARGQGVSRALLKKMYTFASSHKVRQIYCTVSVRNTLALNFFIAQEFIKAGTALQHYRPDTDEIMLYKVMEYDATLPEEQTISVLPLAKEDENQVKKLVIKRLAPYFDDIGDRWIQSMFDGYARRDTRDPNEKYKLIWVAKSPDGTVLGVATAIPKKGEPIKLMPLVAENIQAFSALVSELPHLLRDYGHKLYTHTVPTSIEVEVLQNHGWQVEAMMPEAYKCDVVTQQWGLILEKKVMRMMRVKRIYFDAILAGTKPLEVRVGYNNIKGIKKGEQIRLECGRHSGIVEVTDVRVYNTFEQMLAEENAGHIVPDDPSHALSVLTGIYPKEKETLGVYVFKLKVIEKATER